MKNDSGLRPAGRAVLVRPYKVQMSSSIIVVPEDVANREQMIEQRAEIIEIGPTAWSDEPVPRAQVGEHVFVAKFAGFTAIGPKDGVQYRFVNDKDIFAVITHVTEEGV